MTARILLILGKTGGDVIRQPYNAFPNVGMDTDHAAVFRGP
jgi:hypothetical protein